MTVLHHLELFLDATYEPPAQKRFIFSSRCICNYVERALAVEQFESPYSRVNVHCTKDRQAAHVRPLKEPYLEVCIRFDVESFDALSSEAIQRQFAQIIMTGLDAASSHTPMPIAACSRAIEEFEKGGFRNQWLHLDKSWEKWKCRCIVAAELTMQSFTLDQMVYVEGQLVATRRIAETKPREPLFLDFLGELTINAQGVMRYKKGSKVLSAFDIRHKKFVVTTE